MMSTYEEFHIRIRDSTATQPMSSAGSEFTNEHVYNHVLKTHDMKVEGKQWKITKTV